MGTMFLERISHAMVLLRLSGLPRAGTLYTYSPYVESFKTFHHRNHFNGYRSRINIYSFYSQAIPGETLSTPVIEIGWAFCTINCVLLTAGTFLMFTCINSSKAPRIITEMSKLSYGMYLMHIFWLGLWATVFKYTLALPTVAAIPCIAVSTFICCFITSKLISFIPGSKWIIG